MLQKSTLDPDRYAWLSVEESQHYDKHYGKSNPESLQEVAALEEKVRSIERVMKVIK